MEKTIYIRMRNRVFTHPFTTVHLKDIAQVNTDEELYQKIINIPIHKITKQDKNIIIIDVMKVINLITEYDSSAEVQIIGPSQTIIEVIYKKKGVSIPLFILIWLLLFFGAAMTIMNFHEDVSMKEVHQNLYTIITGKVNPHPLIFQIPYSIGLGLGMILFFNHIFRKRINEEPSPLEVEMFNYQQNLDHYVIMNENKESMKHINDD
ncbi:stage V sporulation protein AA [Bacillus sp. CGMCC 1.16607]|uniref:stage V sporulation protein AA n=1 Tax=Bacillus sp. CGMCC 1.16607 TaxID=3351842 RepID=UPI003626FD85